MIILNALLICQAFPTRVKGDIFEIDIRGAGSGSIIDITSNDKLKAFLKPCAARVDVILEPSHSNHQWFPYWEGKRKMAPQFRSKGIGYLRLGDDMSMYVVLLFVTIVFIHYYHYILSGLVVLSYLQMLGVLS